MTIPTIAILIAAVFAFIAIIVARTGDSVNFKALLSPLAAVCIMLACSFFGPSTFKLSESFTLGLSLLVVLIALVIIFVCARRGK